MSMPTLEQIRTHDGASSAAEDAVTLLPDGILGAALLAGVVDLVRPTLGLSAVALAVVMVGLPLLRREGTEARR